MTEENKEYHPIEIILTCVYCGTVEIAFYDTDIPARNSLPKIFEKKDGWACGVCSGKIIKHQEELYAEEKEKIKNFLTNLKV